VTTDRTDTPGEDLGNLKFSPMGLLRCTRSRLAVTPMYCVVTGLDDEHLTLLPLNRVGASKTRISGFTEWASREMPAVSIGWDWLLTGSAGRVRLERLEQVRSNLMLVDSIGHELGFDATSVELGGWLESFQWQQTVAEHLSKNHAG
jgi:hypothetical protein